MGVQDHAADAARRGGVRCFVLTVSDTRTGADDESGRVAAELLASAGHVVSGRGLVRNDREAIADAARAAIAAGADAVIALGGTGVGPRDVTVEAFRGLMEKELPGFGELFRSLSVAEIGTAAILSRATLGTTADGRVLVVTPGSTGAVRLAVEKILAPQLKHLMRELKRPS